MKNRAEQIEWATNAQEGDYLARYEDDGMTAEEDPGNRCGYSDPELHEIEVILNLGQLTLVADDEGLVVQKQG